MRGAAATGKPFAGQGGGKPPHSSRRHPWDSPQAVQGIPNDNRDVPNGERDIPNVNREIPNVNRDIPNRFNAPPDGAIGVNFALRGI